MGCADKKVTTDLLFDCADRPKKGIDGGNAVIVNFDDIDREASTTNGATITAIVLKSGTSGFNVQWYKDLASANGAFEPNAEDLEGFKHQWLCRLANSSAANAERAAEMAGGRFVMVYETKYKGAANVEAYKVAGWEVGLELSELTSNTAESSGSAPYVLATEDGEYETYPYQVFLKTDHATSKTDYEALFAQA